MQVVAETRHWDVSGLSETRYRGGDADNWDVISSEREVLPAAPLGARERGYLEAGWVHGRPVGRSLDSNGHWDVTGGVGLHENN